MEPWHDFVCHFDRVPAEPVVQMNAPQYRACHSTWLLGQVYLCVAVFDFPFEFIKSLCLLFAGDVLVLRVLVLTNEKLDYMHRNPVTRKLVEHPKDWPWSSWSFYEKGEAGLVRIDPVW